MVEGRVVLFSLLCIIVVTSGCIANDGMDSGEQLEQTIQKINIETLEQETEIGFENVAAHHQDKNYGPYSVENIEDNKLYLDFPNFDEIEYELYFTDKMTVNHADNIYREEIKQDSQFICEGESREGERVYCDSPSLKEGERYYFLIKAEEDDATAYARSSIDYVGQKSIGSVSETEDYRIRLKNADNAALAVEVSKLNLSKDVKADIIGYTEEGERIASETIIFNQEGVQTLGLNTDNLDYIELSSEPDSDEIIIGYHKVHYNLE